MVNFDIDTKVNENYEYINRMMATRYREFKSELHEYFLECGSPDEALANPPMEMDARPGQWKFLCEHFQSTRFLRQSIANKINQAKRPYEHHASSCQLSYIVEECVEVATRDEYIKELAKDYPEDTPSNDIIVPDKDDGLKIMTDVLGVKPGKEIRGLGAGRVRDLKGSSLRTRQLEEQQAAKKAARQAAEERVNAVDAARAKAQEILELMMQLWLQSMQQLAQAVPSFVPPPMIVPPRTYSDQHISEGNLYFLVVPPSPAELQRRSPLLTHHREKVLIVVVME